MTPEAHRTARTKILRVWQSERAGGSPLPEPTPARLQLVAAVAAFETSYGSSKAWAANSSAMVDSHNWGAITCAQCGTPTCAPARDTTQSGASVASCMRVYADDSAGIADLLRLAAKGAKGRELAAGPATIHSWAAAMYQDRYYAGRCPKATARYGALATTTSSFGQRGGATTEAGRACDAEAVELYTRALAPYVLEIAAAHGETPTPTGLPEAEGEGGDWWKWAIVAAVIGGGAWCAWKLYQTPHVRRRVARLVGNPSGQRARVLVANPSRESWRNLYSSGECGPERDRRRELAKEAIRELRAEEREAAAERREDAVKPCKTARDRLRQRPRSREDWRDLYQRGACAKRDARLAAAREANRDARERARERAAELRAEAVRPCRAARGELVEASRREAREREERTRGRSKAQRRATDRAREVWAEKVEAEANNVRGELDARGEPGELGAQLFRRRARGLFGAAKRTGGRVAPYELFLEWTEEHPEEWAAAKAAAGDRDAERLEREQREHWEATRSDDDDDDDDDDDQREPADWF